MLNTVPCGPRAVLPLLKEMYRLRKPAFLWGKPGIGKSDVVREFATQNDMRLDDSSISCGMGAALADRFRHVNMIANSQDSARSEML